MYQGYQAQPEKAEPQGGQDVMQLYKYGHPPLYGTQKGDVIVKPPVLPHRRRLNLVAVCICLFVPWILFCLMYSITSFHLYYKYPALAYFIVFLGLVFVCFLGVKAVHAVIKRTRGNDFDEPTWYLFLFVTSLIAWILGVYLGIHNFYLRMESYYGIENLGNYHDVDPSKTRGQQLMDAGRVIFKPGTHLDLTKSMSFMNTDLYCVTPIVSANHSLKGAESYDFWAVGTNCCCGETIRDAKFRCGEYGNIKASAGLRLMRDEQRPFYRLAVQQALSSYNIRSEHPLFFHWVQDPVVASEALNWEGHRRFLTGVYLHFAFQLACVCLAACCFAKYADD
jgi:hypothetical protein